MMDSKIKSIETAQTFEVKKAHELVSKATRGSFWEVLRHGDEIRSRKSMPKGAFGETMEASLSNGSSSSE